MMLFHEVFLFNIMFYFLVCGGASSPGLDLSGHIFPGLIGKGNTGIAGDPVLITKAINALLKYIKNNIDCNKFQQVAVKKLCESFSKLRACMILEDSKSCETKKEEWIKEARKWSEWVDKLFAHFFNIYEEAVEAYKKFGCDSKPKTDKCCDGLQRIINSTIQFNIISEKSEFGKCLAKYFAMLRRIDCSKFPTIQEFNQIKGYLEDAIKQHQKCLKDAYDKANGVANCQGMSLYTLEKKLEEIIKDCEKSSTNGGGIRR